MANTNALARVTNIEDLAQNTGHVYSWGWGESGQLGHTSLLNQFKPKKIQKLDGERVSFISCGLSHSTAITETGNLYTWGKASYGRLGIPNSQNKDIALPTIINILHNVTYPENNDNNKSSKDSHNTVMIQKRVLSVACGGMHTICVVSKGDVFSFGRNDRGLENIEDAITPRLITTIKKVCLVACGSQHTLFATEKNELYACGRNDSGELGLGNTTDASKPTKVDLKEYSGEKIVSIACGNAFSAAVVGTSLLTWGKNDFGQLGHGDLVKSEAVLQATFVDTFIDTIVTAVACGFSHTVALNDKGEVFTWGSGVHGQLGFGKVDALISNKGKIWSKLAKCLPTDFKQTIPKKVKDALWKKNVISIACGTYHTAALTDTGHVFTWGLNDYGQIGNDSQTSVFEPYQVKSLLLEEHIVEISAGGRQTMAATAYVPLITIPESTMKSDMKQYVNNPELHDVLIRIDNTTLHAHKIILSQCTKFDKIFSVNTNPIVEVAVDDVKYSVFICLLHYLYYEDFNLKDFLQEGQTQEAFVVELMECSEKYGIKALKENLEFKLSVGFNLAPVRAQLPHNLTWKMRNYVNSKSYSDVQFDIQGVLISAHKVMLAARSPHFHALLLGQFKESQEKTITLEDVKPSAFLAMLEFIYTDNVKTIEDDDAVELLTLANEYSLDKLKGQCQEFIQRGIDVENAAWLLEIGERYNAPQLKAFCMFFIIQNMEAVSKTEAFQQLSPDVVELLRKYKNHQGMASSKDKKKKKDKDGCNLQ